MCHHVFFYQHVHEIYQEFVRGDILFLSVGRINLLKEEQTRHFIIVHINILPCIEWWSVLGIAVHACACGNHTGESLSHHVQSEDATEDR